MVRRGLGRGLDALIGGGQELSGAPPAESLLMLRTDQIVASQLQPRQHFDPERLEELLKSIKAQGIIEPRAHCYLKEIRGTYKNIDILV